MSITKTDWPLPWRLVAVMCLCDGAHYYSMCSLFSYGGIMSADLGWVEDRDAAGFVAGLLGSAGMLGRTFTSPFWGLVPARCGYKRAVLPTLGSIAAGGLCFGLSTSLWSALAARTLLLGVGNGWVTMMAPLAAEVAGAERQTDVMGIVMGAGSFTQLFGPAVGGWTYRLWSTYPAAVPSFIGMAYALIAAFLCCLWMPSRMGICTTQYSAPEGEADGSPSKSGPDKRRAYRLLFVWPMPLIVFMRVLHGIQTMGLMDLVPLWAISSRPMGGLAISEREVGSFLARSAVWNILYFMVIMPRGSKCLGIRRFSMFASATAAACCALLPAMQHIAVANAVQMVGMAASISTGAMGAVCTNNVVDPARRSEVNGLVVIFETFGKVLGPACAAAAFARTLREWGRAGHSVVFFGLASLHMLYFVAAACLPSSVEGAPARQSAIPKELPSPEILGSATVANTLNHDAESLGISKLLKQGISAASQGNSVEDFGNVGQSQEGVEADRPGSLDLQGS